MTHWVVRPSTNMILTMKDNKIFALHEKSLNHKDVLSYIYVGKAVACGWNFTCIARPSAPTILTIVNIMGIDGPVRQGAMMCWNQNIAGQDTKANTIASDSVAVAPCILVINTFLIEHKDLFILHSQYHGCRWLGNTVIHFVISVSRSYSENTNISLCL